MEIFCELLMVWDGVGIVFDMLLVVRLYELFIGRVWFEVVFMCGFSDVFGVSIIV